MKRLNFYIGRSLFLTTAAAIGIVTFVMLCGSFFDMFELLSRGVAPVVILKFIVYSVPEAMGFALPLAVLVATVTVFSRMSADQEITAMRAGGVSLWQIITPALLLAVIVSGVCFILQGQVIPDCRFKAKNLESMGNVGNPVAFLEPGRMVQLPGCVVFVGNREGNRIEDIQVYVLDENNQIAQDIHATRGDVRFDAASQTLFLTLEQAMFGIVRGADGTPAGNGELQRMRAESVEIPVVFQKEGEKLSRRDKYHTFTGLVGMARLYERNGLSSLPIYLQLHKRLVMSMAPVAFVLMGIPFGIRTKRSETVAGIIVSLLLSLFFFTLVALADSLESTPSLHPEIIIWLPVVLYQLGGLYALRRVARR
ncbi:MAG: LptF/LptG family permease [Lentisphaeria bacterium]|nr:LptF/LptG family permease [Lentisphaeria bacterium]